MRNPHLGMTVPPLERLGIDTKGLDDLLEKVEKFTAERRNVAGRIRDGQLWAG